jgi:chromosomal replication initiation ATPase DnaA
MRIINISLNEKDKTATIKYTLNQNEWEDFQSRTMLGARESYESEKVIRATYRALDYPIEMYDYVMDRKRSGKPAKIVEVRRACMFQLRKHTDLTLIEIGHLFGFTHASVIHNIKVFQDMLDLKKEREVTVDREVEYILEDLI